MIITTTKIIINNTAELNGKTKKVMKYLMQIKVECFGVAYGVKVKNIIDM